MIVSQHGPVIVYSTAPDLACAERLATGLLENRLAACVQLIPGLTSVYRWKDEIHKDSEVQLAIKTRSANLQAIKDFVAGHHPYEVPELVVVAIAGGSSEYLEWLETESSTT